MLKPTTFLALLFLSTQATAANNCPAPFLTQSVTVFNAVTLCATKDTPRKKLDHAARVAAAWLDNDQDGQPDEPEVLATLKANRATLVMAREGFTRSQFDAMEDAAEDGIFLQDLYAVETDPGYGERDAAPEELHHLIIGAGWMQVYPELFGDTPNENSTIHWQWKIADRQGYYQYNDLTCDAACKTMEFHYMAAAAYLGARSDLTTNEMRIKTRTGLQRKLPEVIRLFESPDYSYPKHHWPKGKYQHNSVFKW